MKLLFTADWLRRKIESGPDVELEAGWPLTGPTPAADMDHKKLAVMPERNLVQMRIALGTLVHQLRQRDQLTLPELAKRAEVSEDELRQIETNPSYTARAYIIYQLSEYFGVSLNNLYQMAGTTYAVERQLYNEAVRYAAHDDVVPLTDTQQQSLNGFVTILNERAERKAGG
jgi:transcriptional regulator with XRE-family HTH domain